MRYSIFIMPSEYVTVYEITQRTPDWWFACIGLLPLIAGAVIIWGKRRFQWRRPHWLFVFFYCLFGVVWIGIVGSTTLLEESDTFTAYQKGEYQTVEGIVTDFRPMPYEGHPDECFSVQDQRFCYSDYVIAPGFHNAASHGGPIHAGLAVRIAYRNGRILRLDIPKDQVPTRAQSAAVTAEGERQWQQRTKNDPLEQKMNTAFLFTAMCWNLQWKRVMRFWLKLPYRPRVEVLFRVFFALNFLGAVIEFVRHLFSHPLTKQDIAPTVRIAAVMCAVVGVMSMSLLWKAQRRDTRAASRPQ